MSANHGHSHDGHHHDAACGHDHDHGDAGARRLAIALCIIAAFAVAEVAGGLMSGSLALLADAGHMITDAAALALALSAQWLSKRPSTDRFPFGLKRAQVLAAFINGLGLLAIVGILVVEAIERLGSPQVIDAPLMLGVAVLGLFANFAAFGVLHGGSQDNVNIRGALLHVAADIFGSVAAILSALVIMATGFFAIDAILTVVVCLLILKSTLPLLRETGAILLQAAPAALSQEEVRDALTESGTVLDVHHMRAWQLTPGEVMLALHAVVPRNADQGAVLRRIKDTLRERFGIEQSTVQIETTDVVSIDPTWRGCPDRSGAAE
jgi:cobalt-zinc-cadmium efflux system protein